MSRKQFDIWDWGAEERLEMATGSHKHGEDDRAIGVGKISQGEDLGPKQEHQHLGCGPWKESQQRAKQVGKMTK